MFRRDEGQRAVREQRKAERQQEREHRRTEAQKRSEADKAYRADLKLYVKEHRKERVAEFSDVHLFSDRIIRLPGLASVGSITNLTAEAECFPVAGVTAVLDQVGAVSARSTLTRTLVPGAHGWQKKIDDREWWLTITGPEFQWVLSVAPMLKTVARQFAAEVTGTGNAAAQDITALPAPAESSTAHASAMDELRKLAELRDAGVVTHREFDETKARLLNNM
ncbi:SHOCT domain-containing protein [Geodermatophilus tzadiensis]|uniref:SHOCT domain-containing protein n=1 Tax=Geodermatophilus tzadiensis TaxID=1137988 RepID=UPI001FE90BD1|nr:SHOCT domain-containing protein [Geodermatophilus tzadiensis]